VARDIRDNLAMAWIRCFSILTKMHKAGGVCLSNNMATARESERAGCVRVRRDKEDNPGMKLPEIRKATRR
jgi:hypothetical protein